MPPYSSLNDLGGRQSYSPDACAGAGDGAGAGILENDNHGAAAGAGIMETDNHIAKARGRVARRAVGYYNSTHSAYCRLIIGFRNIASDSCIQSQAE